MKTYITALLILILAISIVGCTSDASKQQVSQVQNVTEQAKPQPVVVQIEQGPARPITGNAVRDIQANNSNITIKKITVRGFSNIEDGDGRVKAATLDLKVNGQDNPSSLISINNVYPGVEGTKRISLENAGTIDGNLYVNLDWQDVRGSVSDPKIAREIQRLSDHLNVTITYPAENKTLAYNVPITQLSVYNYELGYLATGQNNNLIVEYTVDPEAGNEIQGQGLNLEFKFSLIQA